MLQTPGVGSSSAYTRKAPRPNAVPKRQRTWPLHATRSAQPSTINRFHTQENSPLRRAVNQRIPQARTQVKTSINIHRQHRRPHVLRREPVGRVVAAQVAIVPRKPRVRVGDGHQLVGRKRRVHVDLRVQRTATRLARVAATGDITHRRAGRCVPRGQLDAALARVVAERGELVAEAAAGAGAVDWPTLSAIIFGFGAWREQFGSYVALETAERGYKPAPPPQPRFHIRGVTVLLNGLPGSNPGKLSDGSEGLKPWGLKRKKRSAFNKKLGKQPRPMKLSDPHAPSSAVSEAKKPWASTTLRRAAARRAWSRIVTTASSLLSKNSWMSRSRSALGPCEFPRRGTKVVDG